MERLLLKYTVAWNEFALGCLLGEEKTEGVKVKVKVN